MDDKLFVGLKVTFKIACEKAIAVTKFPSFFDGMIASFVAFLLVGFCFRVSILLKVKRWHQVKNLKAECSFLNVRVLCTAVQHFGCIHKKSHLGERKLSFVGGKFQFHSLHCTLFSQ